MHITCSVSFADPCENRSLHMFSLYSIIVHFLLSIFHLFVSHCLRSHKRHRWPRSCQKRGHRCAILQSARPRPGHLGLPARHRVGAPGLRHPHPHPVRNPRPPRASQLRRWAAQLHQLFVIRFLSLFCNWFSWAAVASRLTVTVPFCVLVSPSSYCSSPYCVLGSWDTKGVYGDKSLWASWKYLKKQLECGTKQTATFCALLSLRLPGREPETSQFMHECRASLCNYMHSVNLFHGRTMECFITASANKFRHQTIVKMSLHLFFNISNILKSEQHHILIFFFAQSFPSLTSKRVKE